MPLLFNYLLHLFLNGFLKIIGIFVGVFFLIDGIESMRRFASKVNFNWEVLVLFILSRLPAFVTMLLPSIALLTTMVVLTTLTRQSEITVMRASGVSLYRILIPFLLGGVVIGAIHVILQDQIVPRTNRAEQRLLDVMTGRVMSSQSGVDNYWLRSDRQIVYAHHFDAIRQVLSQVTVFDFDDDYRLVSRLTAESAVYSGTRWILIAGTLYSFGMNAQAESFQRRIWSVDLDPQKFGKDVLEARFLSLNQLWSATARLRKEGYDTTAYGVMLHRKLADPTTTLAAILLAFPFSLRLPRESGVTASVSLGLVLGFLMFVVIDLATALGLGGRLPPLLAAWSPVAFFFGIGGYLFLHLAEPRQGG